MIRKLQKDDIEPIAKIWLDTNRSAHDFIPRQYWEDHFASVKAMFLQAEVYVYETEQKERMLPKESIQEEGREEIEGFIGLYHNYIAGIFVRETSQAKGIGKQLLDYAKGIKTHLNLKVYQKNIRAVRFYLREGFQVQEEGKDASTDEKEYTMVWEARQDE